MIKLSKKYISIVVAMCLIISLLLIGPTKRWLLPASIEYVGPSVGEENVSTFNNGIFEPSSTTDIRIGKHDTYQMIIPKIRDKYTEKEVQQLLIEEMNKGFTWLTNAQTIVVSTIYKNDVYELNMSRNELYLFKKDFKYTQTPYNPSKEVEKLVKNDKKRDAIFKRYGRIY